MRLRLFLSILCAAAASSAGALVAPAGAQGGDPIAERQEIMKANGRAARTASQMLRGEIPFDAATALGVFQEMNEDAARYGQLFPDGTQTGGETEAAPAIWERPADFQAAVAKFEADTAAGLAAAPQDLAAFQAAFQTVGGNCRSCHEDFRIED